MHSRKYLPLILVAIISTFVVNAYAYDGCGAIGNAISPGPYIGLMGGAAVNSGKQVSANLTNGGTTPATPTSMQAGIRLYLGYKAATFFAVEAGATYFSTINYHTRVPPCGRTKVTFGTGDIVAKVGIPIYIFYAYGIGGVAINYVINTAGLNQDRTCDKSFNQYTFGPIYGVGATLALNQSWSLDFSATRIHVGAMVDNMNFYAIGFSYHDVDVFCGQFLCD